MLRCAAAFAVLSLLTFPLLAQTPAEITSLLKSLQSTDIDTRQEAMRGLQLSLDPRIPEACLPVLQQEGDSIRRLAARAIGSRWHQIPKERIREFTAPLKAQLKSEHEGLVNMARRGIALLEHDWRSPMLSRSKSRRWVIYERRGLPCLIDTKNMTEELLGFPAEAQMSCSWGNAEVDSSVHWHPSKDMAAIDILEGRKHSTVWVWAHGAGLRKLDYGAQLKALGLKDGERYGPGGWFTEFTGWQGDQLTFDLSYAIQKGDDFSDHNAVLAWDPITGTLSASKAAN